MWWAARIIEILLEGIRVQFRDNYSLVTLAIWTVIVFVETPRRLPFQWDQRERLLVFLMKPDSLISVLSFSVSIFFAPPTDPLLQKRRRWETKHFIGMASISNRCICTICLIMCSVVWDTIKSSARESVVLHHVPLNHIRIFWNCTEVVGKLKIFATF